MCLRIWFFVVVGLFTSIYRHSTRLVPRVGFIPLEGSNCFGSLIEVSVDVVAKR